ncbi:MAG TPA: ATP-grasp domain-containing protein [Longimicrobiales bacterium]|nr:ATP-grasp domain-containing protein [Longimicrobiales bacterium]
MRILVHEFVSGGGFGARPVPASLAREGAAMRAALLADLAALPGLELAATADARLGVRTPPGVRVLPPAAGADFRRLVEDADAVWLVAPETHGTLARLAAVVERAATRLLGPGAAAIRRASDKRALARRLAAAGVPVPETRVLADADFAGAGTERLSSTGTDAKRRSSTGMDADAKRLSGAGTDAEALGYPVVVKPARGAGCDGVGLARDAGELRRAVAAARRAAGGGAVLLQRYVAGVAASVSLVGDGCHAVPLAVNAQRVRAGLPFRYAGGETPLRHPLASRAAERAVAACAALPGLLGYVGVDVVLTGEDAVVVEVNPRLTTAYLGLRRALGVNPAEIALAACLGTLPEAPPRAVRRVRFTAGGAARAAEVPA